MAYEHAPFSEGGAAVFFEVGESQSCRAQRRVFWFLGAEFSGANHSRHLQTPPRTPKTAYW